jgi:uncharacterized Ntn-hydrolase superfamily protein
MKPNSGYNLSGSKLAHTYSIVARDPITGEMGVAVQSHWFSVGSIVSWAEAGVGAIATQSFVNASFGPGGLALLKAGKTASQVVEELIASDEGRDFRQLAVVDTQGHVAAYTGQKCVSAAGHYLGDNFSVQANLMLNDQIWPAMARAFEAAQEPLAERMVFALEAAQAAGGDIRGRQSAAILVVRGQASGNIWADRLIDLRVEDHPEPVKELKRLLKVARAYEYMNEGDESLEKNDIEGALANYRTAEAIQPDNLEMKFWHAVSLVNAGRLDEALPKFKQVFAQDGNWVTTVQRIAEVGLLSVDKTDLEKILDF